MKLPPPGQIKSAVMLAGIVAGAYLAYKAYQGAKVVGDVVATDLNPASDENIVYSNTPESVKSGLNGFWGALDSVGLLPR